MRITPLNRKLLRDLLAMKGQALAIAMVVAAGVAMYVMYLSTFDSLYRTRDAYYEQQRFADVFASLKRAPLRVANEIAAIPNVSAIETRVVANVTLDLEGLDEPASGRLVSVPVHRRPLVNDLFLRRGRWIERGRADEVLASEGFMVANKLELGDHVPAVLNGRLRKLTIVGVALSPEFIYSIRPGELVPDDKRFAVFWMDQQALAAAFDMEGGFNDVVLAVAPGASTDEVIARVDRILEPYGGLGAIPRALQLSHWTVQNELSQLQTFGFMLPLVFMLVAAFILNVALTRALALQRPQIASLKALGYDNRSIGWHYLKWALAIGLLGVVLGGVLGALMGNLIIGLYNSFFRFPVLLFSVPPSVVFGATVMTLIAAIGGAFTAVRRAVQRAAGGSHAAGSADAVPPLAPRNTDRLEKSRDRGTHGAAQRDAAPAACRGIGVRHRVRRIDPDDRLRLQRRDRSTDADPVLGGGAAGRDGDLRRAAGRERALRAGTAARRRRRRAAANRGRTHPIGLSRPLSRHHRRVAKSALQAHRRSRRPRDPHATLGGGAVADAGQRARRRPRRRDHAGSARRPAADTPRPGHRPGGRHHGPLGVHGR